ncbi:MULTISPECIES: hypothetical protein [Pseudomonas syringae group]|uniref:hypothetical protein n=1 Tax=Pseudomonas syringae group TaxID=136849 RepID=UPI0006B9419C|nr:MULTISPECIES: hypothetical protein [Pseudomonas syringae group]
MKHQTSPVHLTPDEFASMMEEFDQAGAWMQEQLTRNAQAVLLSEQCCKNSQTPPPGPAEQV